MPTLDISSFRGEIPGIESLKLPQEAAELALNCRFSRGNLDAISDHSAVAGTLRAGVIRSIFLYARQHWFNWTTPVSAIQSPIAQDIYDRVYFTGDGVPKVTSNLIATGSDPKPAAAYTLGVQAPDTPITISLITYTGTNPTDFSDDDTRYYVMTYVTEYGEEGPPGPPSAAAEIHDPAGDTVTLQLPTVSTNTENINRKRIYRTITTGSSTEYFLIGEVTLATTSFIDSSAVTIGKLLDTEDFVGPPTEMQGLTMMQNGIAVGFTGNEVAFSEAYLPYAWKTANRRSTIHKIVAVGATGSSAVVVTEGYPYIYTGVSPDSISETKIEVMQACVSARSLVDMGAYVIYASPHGLVAIADGRNEVITKDIISKREWSNFYPETIHAYCYDGMYIAFYGDENDNGSGIGGFVFDPLGGAFVEIDFYATAGFVDILTDSLTLVQRTGGVSQLRKWEGSASKRTYRWRSKTFPAQNVAFTCIRVDTDDPVNVGLKIFNDGKLLHTWSYLPEKVNRLPEYRSDDDLQFEITGTATVRRVTFGTDMRELSGQQ